MDSFILNINGQDIQAKNGMTVLQAAQAYGIYIPTLCNSPDLKPYGACRICVVEIDGMRGLPTSCTTPALPGMRVHTDTEAVNKVRKTVLELLIADHPADCLTCTSNGNCELQNVAAYLGMTTLRLPKKIPTCTIDASNPFFTFDRNKCILCGRCTRTCNEISCVGAIDMANRGYAMKVATFGDTLLFDSICQSCGECVAHCPVGALAPVNHLTPTREVQTTCPYCGVGCQITLGIRNDRIVSTRGYSEGPSNSGKLCVKGRFGISEVVHSQERLSFPLIRKNGKLEKSSWEEALELIADKFLKYKPEELAVISSSRASNEDNYVSQKFARAVLGTNNVDNCARVCHGPSVAGLAITFGSGAQTNNIKDFANAACILSIGSNTTAAHPIIGFQVKQAILKGTKLIFINPRETSLVKYADLWLRLKPGTDVALVMGMIRIIVEENLQDKTFIDERCENFEAFKESLKEFPLDNVVQITGVPAKQIIAAARMYATIKPSAILYTLGITEHSHGTDNVMSLANLAMVTGNIGKPGSGVNPLRGQNNVQGACDMGALPGSFPGYQTIDNPDIRKKFETSWGVALNNKPGLFLTEMYKSALEKHLKAAYIIGEDPVLSEPDMNHTVQALKNLDFLVVQDIFLSETCKLADVVLPAASFASDDGTFTNTERRVQRIRKAVPAPGEARPDWEIVCLIARKMGKKGFDYRHASEIWQEMISLTPNMTGITYERLEKGGIQWPCPDLDHPGTPILHTKTFTRGKGKFMPLIYRPSAELPDQDFPFILTTERSLFHYHTGTMTRQVPGLNKFKNEEFVEINPEDASTLGVLNNDWVTVTSRRGKVNSKVKITEDSPVGVVAMTFHFSECPTNALTNAALDPISKTPEYKVCAVKLEKSEAPN
jgi:formate dehydrogenase (NADP+) alpha subunit